MSVPKLVRDRRPVFELLEESAPDVVVEAEAWELNPVYRVLPRQIRDAHREVAAEVRASFWRGVGAGFVGGVVVVVLVIVLVMWRQA
jgi:hypothetical protein